MNVYLFISVMLPLALSPGPANSALANHSLTFGMKNTLSFFAGMMTSSFFIVLGISIFANALISETSTWFIALQIIGALYITFLAYKFFKSAYSELADTDEYLSYWYGLTLNATNPKFYLMASVLITQFPINSNFELVLFISLFITLNAVGNISWILLGSFGSKFNNYKYAFITQKYIYSIALAGLSLYLLLEAVKKIN